MRLLPIARVPLLPSRARYSFEEMELAYWPLVQPTDRCGAGETVNDGTETVACRQCIHWFQPGGVGIRPDYRQGLSVEWWEHSGYCTRFAPGPSSDEDRRAWFRVTHASDRCGDGEEVKVKDLGPDLFGELST